MMSLTRQEILEMDIYGLTNLLDSEGIQYDHHETLEGMQELYLERMHAASSESCEDCPLPTMSHTQEDINNMDMIELSELLGEVNIPYDHLETLQEMQELYWERMHATSSEKCADCSNQAVLTDITANDRKMRVELAAIYDNLIDFFQDRSKDVNNVKSMMNEIYGDFGNTLSTSRDELIQDDCPIVVTGETSAGKSSLLNLILGTDVLAHSILGCTSTICRLHNSTKKRFDVHSDTETDSREIGESGVAWKEDLEKTLTIRDEHNKPKYKQVDVYWPIPMLQEHVTIVDTPGIGENDSLKDVLLSYLPKAVAFIYVINSANAGGIQDDHLLNILNQQEVWAMEGRPTAFSHECMIFVCNKWDKVQKEEDKVWHYTLDTISKTLPNFPEEQIFKMSTTEADRYLKSGLGRTEKFETLTKGIEKLILRSMKGKIKKHYTWIEKFLIDLDFQLSTRINHANKEKEARVKLWQEVQSRLTKLKTNADKVKTKLKKAAGEECQTMVDKLSIYVQREDVKKDLLSWKDVDIPDAVACDFAATKLMADRLIRSRINNVLTSWEQRTHIVKQVSEKLGEMFISDCQLLRQTCKDINVLIQGSDETNKVHKGKSAVTTKLQTRVKEENVFTKTEKGVIALTSPIWFPLATAAVIIGVPIVFGMALVQEANNLRHCNAFMKNKTKYMRRWTEEMIASAFAIEEIRRFIADVYWSPFNRKIDMLCSDFIPKQITADHTLVTEIRNDQRSSSQIKRTFTSLLNKVTLIRGKLRQYKIKFLDQEIKMAFTQTRQIHKGKFSDVYRAKLTDSDKKEIDVAVKVLNCITEDTLGYLDNIECLRKLEHPNIVEVYGVCCSEIEDNEDKKLTLVLELCEDSLENIVFKNERLQCWKCITTASNEALPFYLTMAKGVCSGLEELHLRGCLHKDLKLSNVLVNNETAKLCAVMTESVAGTSKYMPPEVLKEEGYTQESDIYCLGVMLWELWYGRHVYTEDEYASYTLLQMTTAIINSEHPKLTYTCSPSDILQKLMKDCWNCNQGKRPDAYNVRRILHSIEQAN